MKKIVFAISLLITTSFAISAEIQSKLNVLNALISHIKTLETDQAIALVNKAWNSVPYKSDHENWSKQDYWATPYEMLSKNAGDCEDFAIAKYFTLAKAGLSTENLYFAYVNILRDDSIENHMVLVYEKNGKKLILDNLSNEVTEMPVAYEVVFEFGENFVRLNGHAARISNNIGVWAELIQKMRNEKFI